MPPPAAPQAQPQAKPAVAKQPVKKATEPGAVTAMQEAAKDPETAAKAKAWLKQAGVGK